MNDCGDADCKSPKCECLNEKAGWRVAGGNFTLGPDDLPVWATIEDENGMRRVALVLYVMEMGGICETDNIYGEEYRDTVEYMGGEITHWMPMNKPRYPAGFCGGIKHGNDSKRSD